MLQVTNHETNDVETLVETEINGLSPTELIQQLRDEIASLKNIIETKNSVIQQLTEQVQQHSGDFHEPFLHGTHVPFLPNQHTLDVDEDFSDCRDGSFPPISHSSANWDPSERTHRSHDSVIATQNNSEEFDEGFEGIFEDETWGSEIETPFLSENGATMIEEQLSDEFSELDQMRPRPRNDRSIQDEEKLQALLLAKNPRHFLKGFLAGSFLTLAVTGVVAYSYYWDEIQSKMTELIQINTDCFKQQRALEILKYGVPTRPPPIIYHTNHVLAYDSTRKTPIWVAEHLTKKSIEGHANRKSCRFQPDPKLKGTCFTASNDDFCNSGWSRGHMASDGNNKHNQVAMNETFYLTNVVPQDIENNGGFWNRLELYCRELTKRYKDVRVISGPLYMAHTTENRKYVQYEVIGENNVAVPTHLYKIVVAENPHESPIFVGAFIVPNAPISYEQSLTEFQVPLKKLEKEMGITFTSKLDRYKVQDLCQVDGCVLLVKTDFQKYFLSRNLENTSTLKQLEKAWKKIENYGFKEDQKLSQIYKDKKQLLMEHRPESERL